MKIGNCPYFRAVRAFSFPLSALPVWIGTAAARRPAEWRWDVLAACTAGALAFHAAGNLLNDYFDFLSGVDTRTHDDEGRPGRLLVRGEMSPREVLGEAMACLLVGALPAAYLLRLRGAALLWFIAPGIAALYAYTGPPFRLKARALGEPLVFAVFGPLLAAGAAFAQTGAVGTVVLLASLPAGMAPAAVLAGNNLRDYEEDAAAGVRTLAHVIGPGRQRTVYAALVVGQSICAALLPLTGRAHPLIALAPLLLGTLAAQGLAGRFLRGERIPDIDARTARYGAGVMLAVLLALSFG